jgi:murein DD-endopeptidase MepM/ murein hydrolase activator NlpD
VNFKYISSSFKKKRFHPVQKRWKAHNGIDYAAKRGTPVVAAGNGKVTHSGYNKNNGNYVFIQHGNGIVTKYLHFYKRPSVKKGQRVKQDQVIGYVGSTGLAAGPHLHYEFLLNGVHRNPRTVKLPEAKPINKKYKAEFAALSSQRLLELSGSRQALLAMQRP